MKDTMKDTKRRFPISKTGLVLCAALWGTLTGCVGYVDGPRAGYSGAPAEVYAQDDYVYYPQYECYYSVSRHQYAYREGNEWVSRGAPRGVSVNVLLASPSVKMTFHDAPAQHHADVVKQYPRNWKPAAPKEGQNRKDDQRGQGDGR
jgi:hypothetical protein